MSKAQAACGGNVFQSCRWLASLIKVQAACGANMFQSCRWLTSLIKAQAAYGANMFLSCRWLASLIKAQAACGAYVPQLQVVISYQDESAGSKWCLCTRGAPDLAEFALSQPARRTISRLTSQLLLPLLPPILPSDQQHALSQSRCALPDGRTATDGLDCDFSF